MREGAPDGAHIRKTIAQIEASADVREIIAHLSAYASRFGFTTVALGHVVNPQIRAVKREKLFQFSTWRKEWTDVWAGKNLIIRDPIARYSLFSHKPFRWRDAFSNDRTRDKEVEHLIREFGFTDGVTIPIHTDGYPPGAVSLGADKFEISPEELGDLHIVCVHAYGRIEEMLGSFPYQSAVKLTLREREILHYVAGGKTNWEIGAILSISPHSVRDHIQSASKKLGAAGRAHTVAIALRMGLILP